MYVGYRYFEVVEVEPLFPFGHGLSYTSFALSNLNLSRNGADQLIVRCSLTNTGSRAGAEVVQVYIAPILPPIKRPVKELKGFSKNYLERGQTVVVEVVLHILRATSFWDEKEGRWCSHSGQYKILVGTSSTGRFLEASTSCPKTRFWSGL